MDWHLVEAEPGLGEMTQPLAWSFISKSKRGAKKKKYSYLFNKAHANLNSCTQMYCFVSHSNDFVTYKYSDFFIMYELIKVYSKNKTQLVSYWTDQYVFCVSVGGLWLCSLSLSVGGSVAVWVSRVALKDLLVPLKPKCLHPWHRLISGTGWTAPVLNLLQPSIQSTIFCHFSMFRLRRQQV